MGNIVNWGAFVIFSCLFLGGCGSGVGGSALSIRTKSISSVTLGAPYNASLVASGGAPPYRWSVDSASLPRGLSLSSSGILSGTGTAAGSANVIFTVRDSIADSISRAIAVAVTAASAAPLTITSTASLPSATVGSPYNFSATATGGVPPYTWSVPTGGLTSGLTLSAAGILSGTPTTAGSSTPSLLVSDSTGATASTPVHITVNPGSTVNHPAMTCIATPATVPQGTNVTIVATAGNSGGSSLTYSFTTTAGTITSAGNVATLSTTGLTAGGVSVGCSASYASGTTSAASASVTVTPANTSTTLLATPNTAVTGQAVVLTAQVAGSAGTPAGSVSFFDGAIPLGTSSLNASGIASFTTSSLTDGSHLLTAQFTGNSLDAASTSQQLQVNVAQATTGEQALQADAFVDSVGVAAHLAYDNTPYYTAWPQVLSKLQSLGVRHIRDGFYNWPSSSPYIAEHQALATSGIKCTYVIPLDNTTTPQIVQSFASNAQDLEAVEAPNECDAGGNCGGGGSTGVNNVVAFLPTVYAAGQALHVPVLGPSFTRCTGALLRQPGLVDRSGQYRRPQRSVRHHGDRIHRLSSDRHSLYSSGER